MATITNAILAIQHDHEKKLAHAVVRCTVNFTGTELCLMRQCREQRMFKLKCELWGADSGLTGGDDHLYTYGLVYHFPDSTPSQTESRSFDVTLGEGVLDEDWGTDEVYGKLMLQNLFSMVQVSRKTNEVSHNF